MKKVKLMLLSLSVLAIVGGTLAFTAKTGAKVCVADPDGTSCNKACPVNASIKSTSLNLHLCTAATNNNPDDPCSGVQCASFVQSIVEQ